MQNIIYNIKSVLIVIIFFSFCFNTNAEPEEQAITAFVHPGLTHSAYDLDFIKAKVNAQEEPWKSAFNAMKNSNYGKLTWRPQPRANVACGFYNNPNFGCHEQTDDALAAYTHALLWYITDDQRYADKAIEILNAWTNIDKANTDKNAPLQVGWSAPGFIDAAEIIRYSDAGWSEAEISAFSNYIREVYLPIIVNNNPYNPNWMFSILQARLSIAVFTNDLSLFVASKVKWNERIVNMIYQTTDGPKPVRIGNDSDANMDRNWYGSWNRDRWFDGFSQETCRDLGHLFLGSKSMSYSGQILYQQGVDVFDTHKYRIQDFVEFHCGIYNGKPYSNDICGGPINANGRNTYRSGSVTDTHMEVLYYHLHDRLGLELPEAEKLVLRSRPRNAARWFNKWETLAFANLDCNCVTPPIIKILYDKENNYFKVGDTAKITVELNNEDDVILERIDFRLNDQVLDFSSTSPFTVKYVTDSPGIYTFNIDVFYNEGRTISARTAIHVSEEKAPYYGEPLAIPGILQAEDYDFGGEGVSYHDTDREQKGYTFNGVDFRINDGVDVTAHPSDGYVVGWNTEGEWLEYSVDVERSGTYKLRFYYSAELNTQVALSIDGDTVLNALSIPSTGGATNYFSKSQDVFLNNGKQVWRLITESGRYNLDRIKITLENATSTYEKQEEKPTIIANSADSRSFFLSEFLPWEVYSIMGVKVKSGKGNVLELSDYPNGVYMVAYANQIKKIVLK